LSDVRVGLVFTDSGYNYA